MSACFFANSKCKLNQVYGYKFCLTDSYTAMNQNNSKNVINFHPDFNRFVDETCSVLEGLQLPSFPLEYVLKEGMVNQDGLWLEFGVASGRTINLICKYRKKGVVYGFDSFEGLPEYWRSGYPKGTFKQAKVPEVKSNAVLKKDLFADTLPQFILAQRTEPVSLLHIDCDLYSSTQTVLSYLGSRLTKGSIIVFDELIDYPGFEKHELKAFYEFGRLGTHKFQWIGANDVQTRKKSLDYSACLVCESA